VRSGWRTVIGNAAPATPDGAAVRLGAQACPALTVNARRASALSTSSSSWSALIGAL
jgi:hypothetical protein